MSALPAFPEACRAGAEWLRLLPEGITAREAWEQCPRADWLLWAVAEVAPGAPTTALAAIRPTLVLAAAVLAREVLPLTRDKDRASCLAAIEAAEAWARAPSEQRRKAAYAADAVDAVDLFDYAARGAYAARAAYAAARAAYAAYATDAATDAADAAVFAVDAADPLPASLVRGVVPWELVAALLGGAQ